MITSASLADSVSFRDLEFEEARVLAYGSRGTPYVRTVRYGMPKIPPVYLRNTVYLYPSEDAAKEGRDIGGTGFVTGIQSAHSDKFFFYFVTNWHVACQGSPVVRVNTRDGKFETFPFDCADWIFSPDFDIAVIPAPLNLAIHDVSFVPAEEGFLTEEIRNAEGIGPGDDVFMVGRFIDHDGKEQNNPSVRFGHISMDPTPILQKNRARPLSYCIDLHSRSGYSGSPVYVYRTPGYDLSQNLTENKILLAGTNFLMLLGIHWGQFPEDWEVTSEGEIRSKIRKEDNILSGKFYIQGLSGMTCVMPAWKIWELLSVPALKDRRDKGNAQLLSKAGNSVPVAEAAELAEAKGTDSPQGDEILRRMLNTPPKRDG